MIKLGTMSLNVRNTTATEFAGIVSDLGLDVIELHSSAFESTDLDYLRDLKMDLMKIIISKPPLKKGLKN